MTKRTLLIIFAILFLPIYLLGQSKNTEKTFSIGFQVGYLFPQNKSNAAHTVINGGIELRPSFHYKISKTVTTLFEYNISKHKYVDKENSYYMNHNLLNVALRIFPKTDALFYIKPGLGFFFMQGNNGFYDYSLNFGIGNDFKLSKDFDLFAETEMFFNIRRMVKIDYSLSVGVKYKIF